MLELKNTSYADVLYDDETFCLQIIWKPNMTDDDYKNVFNFCLDYAESHRVDTFLSDIRNQKIISPETRKWFEDDAMPRGVQTGLQRAAIIFTGNVFKKYYANNILLKSKNLALPLKLFTSVEDAYKWFESFKE